MDRRDWTLLVARLYHVPPWLIDSAFPRPNILGRLWWRLLNMVGRA